MLTKAYKMKDIIRQFQGQKKLAVVGASPSPNNFGRSLMLEFARQNIEPFPVNPGYMEVEGRPTVPSVEELPSDVDSVIIATHPSKTDEIIDQCIASHIKRVWMIKGVGRGAYTPTAHQKCLDNDIAVVHGFCPMMFFGEGMHHFHLWLRKTFGKLPAEYIISEN